MTTACTNCRKVWNDGADGCPHCGTPQAAGPVFTVVRWDCPENGICAALVQHSGAPDFKVLMRVDFLDPAHLAALGDNISDMAAEIVRQRKQADFNRKAAVQRSLSGRFHSAAICQADRARPREGRSSG